MLLTLLIAATLLTAESQRTPPPTPPEEIRFREMDDNNDGVITRAEWRGNDRSFAIRDWNNDGILSGDEVRHGAFRPGLGGGQDRSAGDRRTAVPRGTTGRQENCSSNAPRIVDDIYQQVLERPADATSAPMTQALADGRATVSDIVAQLAKSEEHSVRFVWAPIVVSLYRETLNRQPSQEELRATAADLSSGQGQMLDVIARIARRASRNDESAVRILYRRILGREADPEGLRSFTDQARRDGIESVARALVASPEYRQRGGGLNLEVDERAQESAVRALYRHVLGRQPDAQGVRDLMQLASVYGIDGVVDRMIAMPEYRQAYGSDGVPGRDVRYCASQP